jgi:sigma-B regulation protein RsbU (phosphoserine phosphatase)
MGGRPLGIEEKPSYESMNVELGPGDSIILFSDGILDAIDSAGRRFGRDRLREVMRTDPKAPPASAINLGERIKAAVENHVAGGVPFDDISLVVYGRRWAAR